jgi:hypothetical protein
MGLLAGILRTEDGTLARTIPLADILSGIEEIFTAYEEQLTRATSLFVAETTTKAEERVVLNGIDEGQAVDRYGRALETRTEGGYDVAYPWIRQGWAHGWDHEAFQYLTVGDIQRVLDAQVNGNRKWHLRSIFGAMYNNANWTHQDNETGTNRNIKALANQDGTLYPASAILEMAESQAEANHYVVSNYLSSAISSTNNPLATIRAKLRMQYPSGRIVAFINSAQLIDVRDKLPNFIDAPASIDASISQTASVAQEPGGLMVPGDYIGVDGDTNVHVFTYDSTTPSGYITGQVIGRPPLKKRIPTAPSLQGFLLEAEEEFYPLHRREFRDRSGYGVFDRLSVAIVQLKGSGAYDVPLVYQK